MFNVFMIVGTSFLATVSDDNIRFDVESIKVLVQYLAQVPGESHLLLNIDRIHCEAVLHTLHILIPDDFSQTRPLEVLEKYFGICGMIQCWKWERLGADKHAGRSLIHYLPVIFTMTNTQEIHHLYLSKNIPREE